MAATPNPSISTGSIYTYSSFVANIVSIDWSGMERASINTSSLGSGATQTFTDGDLVDYGSVTIEHQLKADQDITTALNAAASDLVITFPDTATGAARWTCSAFMTGYEWNMPTFDSDVNTATATFKVAGLPVIDTVPV